MHCRLKNVYSAEHQDYHQEDEFFYPLVLINNEVVGEGYVQ
ncbi:DUF1462 family protein [Lysinibacillus fusiformis]|nr:DUF1462 family protein [Lysinibacillus fusiformis]